MAPAVANQAFALAEQHRFDKLCVLREIAWPIEDNRGRAGICPVPVADRRFRAGLGRPRSALAANVLVDRKFTQPLWLGDESIEGKTILLHADEGLGDVIHFARYVPMVAALGARVILEVRVHPFLM